MEQAQGPRGAFQGEPNTMWNPGVQGLGRVGALGQPRGHGGCLGGAQGRGGHLGVTDRPREAPGGITWSSSKRASGFGGTSR